MSESNKNLDPSDPAYYAPPRLRERSEAAKPAAKDVPTPPRDPDASAVMRPAKPAAGRLPSRSDAFNEALVKVLREEMNAKQDQSGFVPPRRSSLRAVATVAVGVATAALVTLGYVARVSSPPRQAERSWAAVGTSPAARSIPVQPLSTLVVRNQSGTAGDALDLGISVDSPVAGSTVSVKGLPPDARLTAGLRFGATEWLVRADDVAQAKVVPPPGFVGDISLSAELRDGNGAAMVTGFVQLSWQSRPTGIASSALAAAAPPQPLRSAAPGDGTVPLRARPEQGRELRPNEVAILVRQAQELLATGDVKAARALLLRATEAQDPRAALALAKTYDPLVTRQAGAADGPDALQARNWYQKAREWGAPEAQRLLDALASYR